MLELSIRYGLPLIILVGMLSVGLSVHQEAVSQVFRRPRRLLAATLLQIALVPMVGIMVVIAVDPAPAVASALLVLAACPGGGMSNLYVLIAGANTFLSVCMTLVTVALSSLTIPTVLLVFWRLGFEFGLNDANLFGLSLQLLIMVSAPIAVGMVVRNRRGAIADRWEGRLRNLALGLVGLVLILTLWDQSNEIAALSGQIVLAASLFLAGALAAGAFAGSLVYSDVAERFAVTVEFGVRNIAIGSAVALGVQGNLVFAGPAAIYFVLEVIAVVSLSLLLLRQRTRA